MDLTKKAKIILGSLGAGVVVLGAGLGIWQPWNQPVTDGKDPDAKPEENMTEVTRPEEPEEKPLTLLVGGNEIECVLYEGEGWTMYVPVDWVAEDGAVFRPAEGSRVGLKVEYFPGPYNYAGDFSSAYAVETVSGRELTRLFYAGNTQRTWQLFCSAPEDQWDDYQKLMTAMARTFAVGEDMLFSGFSPVASEPEWQISDGVTTMWMDKDGYIVDDVAEEHVVTTMLAWDNDYKMNFTGQYSLAPFHWSGSYTCVPGKEYIDVFRSQVRYEVAEGKEENITLAGGSYIADGWLSDGFWMDVVIYHDGSAIKDVKIVEVNDCSAGGPWYISDLVVADAGVARELTAEELQQITDWFMQRENNGLLRFPYVDADGAADYLNVLFYDLGETEDKLTDEEKAALEAAGGILELDTFKLKRAYVEAYAEEKLGVYDGKKWLSENELYMPGIYLPEYDAWYTSHGDTKLTSYTFDSGLLHPSNSGCIVLYYTAPYLTVMDTDGLTDVPMVLTLRYEQGVTGGRWVVASNIQGVYA